MFRFVRKRPSRPVLSIHDDSWTVLVSDVPGAPAGPMFIRRAEWAKRIRGHADYPIRLGISTPLCPGENDWTNIDMGVANQFEEVANSTVAIDMDVLHVLVITSPEFKELVYYAKDAGEAERRAQDLNARLPDLEVTHYTEPDPDWLVYRNWCKRRPRL